MTAAADTTEFLSMWGGLNGKYRGLMFEVMLALSKSRLTCNEVDAAQRKICAGADKIETLEDLVQLANERLIEGEVAA
jgi:tRNA U54 and U55 pseudouridine synthase Pus10